jgi:hypothetical protein
MTTPAAAYAERARMLDQLAADADNYLWYDMHQWVQDACVNGMPIDAAKSLLLSALELAQEPTPRNWMPWIYQAELSGIQPNAALHLADRADAISRAIYQRE